MEEIDGIVNRFFSLLQHERSLELSSNERKIYNIFLDGLSLDDEVSIAVKKNNLKNIFSVIQKYLGMTSNPLVLDAGCGIGNQSFLFSLMGAKRVIGVDINENRLKLARKRKIYFERYLNLNVDFVNDDIFKILSSNKPDLIYCKDSISHIHPLEKFLDLGVRSLNEQGFLVVDEPNVFNPFILVHVLKQYYKVTGGFRYYTREIINPLTGEKVTQAEERMISPGKLKKMTTLRQMSFLHLSYEGGWLLPKSTIAKMIQSKSLPILNVFQSIENAVSQIPVANLFFRSYLAVAQKTKGINA